MIELRLNQENFEYDIYSLLKAFYPKEVIGKNLKEAEMILLWGYHLSFLSIGKILPLMD